MVVLDTANTTGHLLLNQSASVTASTIAVNGNNNAATTINAGSTLTANTITLQGGLVNNGGTVNGTLIQHTGTPAPDPLAGLTPPSVPSATCPGTACPGGPNYTSGGIYNLLPGHYTQALGFPQDTTFCVAPGIYYIDASWTLNQGDQFLPGTATSGKHPTCSPPQGDPGVLLYFHSGNITINQGVTFTHLSGMQSGPYAHLLYWQVGSNSVMINQGSSVSGGTWYEPAGALVLNQSAEHVAVPQLIVKDLTVNAGSTVTVGS
jgi:hypothetical protein